MLINRQNSTYSNPNNKVEVIRMCNKEEDEMRVNSKKYDAEGRLPLSVIKEMKQVIKEDVKKQGLTLAQFQKSLEDIKNEK